jgi:peptide/nickel transport system permease protein
MWRYIFLRVLASIPVILVVGIITFSILHIAPGDPAAIIGGDEATVEDLRRIRAELGLDRPIIVQFWVWIQNLLSGDLGTSIFSKRSIVSLMAPRIQPTLSLGIQVIIMSTLLGVGTGIIAAWKAGRPTDRIIMFFAVLGFSTPGFWLAFILIWGLAVNLRWFPVIGYTPISEGILAHLHSMFLPVMINSILSAAFISRITRSAMLDVLREDYVRTARAKGLRELVVYLRHAFRPASIPVVTVIGASIAGLSTGFVITETIFAIPGLGRMLIEAITRRDFPIIQAMLMVAATGYVMINLAVDILYAYLDPRIRY